MKVSRELEWEALQKVCLHAEKLAEQNGLTPQNTVVAMVSPDYSATVAMHVAHHLSKDGEMLDIIPVDIPYPDQDPAEFQDNFTHVVSHKFDKYQNVILVEGGVISGKTFEFIDADLRDRGLNVFSIALFENNHSTYWSDIVGFYYDWKKEPLEFYWERENKHWNF
jgi:hypothetical protein